MYCPHCGQERISSETSFCSRCGFLLTGVGELLANGGIIPGMHKAIAGDSPRKKGLKMGLFIFLLTFLAVPLVAILSRTIGFGPTFVAITAIILSIGGLLRMLYAALFESPMPAGVDAATFEAARPAFINRAAASQGALPPEQSIPASTYAPPEGKWRDTKNLEPGSVTENTTKLLEKEDQ